MTDKFVVLPVNIFITGASSGIGEYVAYEYSKRGATIALCARRKEKLENIAQKCESLGAKIYTYSVDVTDQHSTKESIEDFLSKVPTIDLVFANAGLGLLDFVEKGDPSVMNDMINTNVIGVNNTVVPFIPKMLEQYSGHIAVVGSVASFVAWPGSGAYAGSKWAVRALTGSLRNSLPKQIAVTLICPGFVKSEMTDPVEFKPFLIGTEKAAKKIVRALDKRRKVFIFPWQWNIVVLFRKLIYIFMGRAFQKKHDKFRLKNQSNLSA